MAQSVHDHYPVRSVTGLEDHDAAVAGLLLLPPVGQAAEGLDGLVSGDSHSAACQAALLRFGAVFASDFGSQARVDAIRD